MFRRFRFIAAVALVLALVGAATPPLAAAPSSSAKPIASEARSTAVRIAGSSQRSVVNSG